MRFLIIYSDLQSIGLISRWNIFAFFVMLTKGAIGLLSSQRSSQFYPVLQIVKVKTRKSGYFLRLSDSLQSIKCLYPCHKPVPVLLTAILIEDYEIVSPLFILLKYSIVQSHSSIEGSPEKIKLPCKVSTQVFTPIRKLTSNTQNSLLKLRLISKSSIESSKNSFNNYFTALFLDENNDEILLNFPNDTIDQYYATLELKKMYLVSPAKVRKNGGDLKGKYIINIDKNSKLVEIFDDHSIKADKCQFLDIKSILKLNLPKRVNTCGVVKSVNNSKVSAIEIQDRSNSIIHLFCSDLSKAIPKYSVIVCKNIQYEPNSGVLISDSASTLLINPKGYSEVEALLELSKSYWKSISNSLTILEIKELAENNNYSDELVFSATVTEVITDEIHPYWYPACINVEKCSKKVESHSFGFFYCKECGIKSEKFSYRYAVEIGISDFTGCLKVKLFDSVARLLFGAPAEDLVKKSLETNKEYAENIFDSVIGKQYNFAIGGKGKNGKSILVSRMSLINPATMTKLLLTEIKQILA